MIIYEVNLIIAENIFPEYLAWLQAHIKEILNISGFIQASILEPESAPIKDQKQLTIQYQLKTREDLARYLTDFAPQMRAEGIKHFQDNFSAHRRIFKVKEVLENVESKQKNWQKE